MSQLVITKNYSITLDSGESYEMEANTVVDNVGESLKRDVKVSTTEATILLIGAATAAGQLTGVKFFVVQNNDSTNFAIIRYEDTGGHTVDLKLEPGASMDLFNDKVSVDETGGAFSAFSDIDTISATADTSDVVLTLFAGEAC
jgi:hypothetical protein